MLYLALVTRCKYFIMKPTSFLTLALTAALLLFAVPVLAQNSSTDTTTAVHESRAAEKKLKMQMQLNTERTQDARDLNKEYSDKAKDARRIERDAENASKQAAKAVKLERKAQKAREKADKQKQIAKEAAEKSDSN